MGAVPGNASPTPPIWEQRERRVLSVLWRRRLSKTFSKDWQVRVITLLEALLMACNIPGNTCFTSQNCCFTISFTGEPRQVVKDMQTKQMQDPEFNSFGSTFTASHFLCSPQLRWMEPLTQTSRSPTTKPLSFTACKGSRMVITSCDSIFCLGVPQNRVISASTVSSSTRH